VQEIVNYPFTTSDGVQLMGSVYYPTNLSTGGRAPGRFPVLVDMTPYGMWDGNSTSPRDLSDDQILRYFTAHGYIGVEVDARGSGRSEGDYTFEDPRQMKDDVEVIDFVAHRLEGSNGVVGLTSMSYRGLNQLLVGGVLEPGTPVKAMAPASAGSTSYDDPFFAGGIPGAFWHAYGGIETYSEIPPFDQVAAAGGADLVHTVKVAQGRVPTVLYHGETWENTASGGDIAHRDQWWLEREPIYAAQAIVKAGVPALLTSGWGDFFARGSLAMYAALQNVSHGHSPWAAMDPHQAPDPRYQLVWSDVYTDGNYSYWLGYDLQWYDHWLKGVENGVGGGEPTLHLQEHGGSNPWVSAPNSVYPFTTSYTPYYLGAGQLSSTAAAAAGSDALSWGPNQTLTYTSAPLPTGATIAGPVSASIFASSTTSDVELVATLNDVAPDGSTSTTVPGLEVDGALIGSQRSIDPSRTWTDSRGQPTAPYHAYSTVTEQPVPTGALVRYDIQLHPRLWALQPGHRLQLVLTSQNPLLYPTAPQLAGLAGGSYSLQRGGASASFLNLPLLPLSAFSSAGDPTKTGLGSGSNLSSSPAPPHPIDKGSGSAEPVSAAAATPNTSAVASHALAGVLVPVTLLSGLVARWRRRRH
jgi:predicted acyl esterase